MCVILSLLDEPVLKKSKAGKAVAKNSHELTPITKSVQTLMRMFHAVHITRPIATK